jgi:hypothetical protein
MTILVLPPLAAANSARMPAVHSCSDSVAQALAFCGHTSPATCPRRQKATCAASPDGSSAPSGVQGVQAMG